MSRMRDKVVGRRWTSGREGNATVYSASFNDRAFKAKKIVGRNKWILYADKQYEQTCKSLKDCQLWALFMLTGKMY